MRTENNISFKSRIKNPINSKDKLVRFSINHLKHNIGGFNVEHELTFNKEENYLMVFTRLFPKPKVREAYNNVGSFRTFKRLNLISKEHIVEQAKVLANWIKRTNEY